MKILMGAAWVAVAYLYGSVSFALLLTRLVQRTDIRTIGNRNAGAANVGRNLGLGWGILVFFLDMSKGVAPIALARLSLHLGETAPSVFLLLGVGLAAFIGHCRPLYHGFRGGRGISTAIGVYLWFVPVEVVAAMLIGAALVVLIVHNVEHRLGPYTPIAIVALTPFFTLFATLFLGGGASRWSAFVKHPWYLVVGIFLFSLAILSINLPFMRERSRELRASLGPGEEEETEQHPTNG